jgi:hypothetical protein
MTRLEITVMLRAGSWGHNEMIGPWFQLDRCDAFEEAEAILREEARRVAAAAAKAGTP